LFTKGGLHSAIHVDDGVASGADKSELDAAVGAILGRSPHIKTNGVGLACGGQRESEVETHFTQS